MVPLWSTNANLLTTAPPGNNSGDARVTPSDSPEAVTAKTLDQLFQPDSVQFVKIDCQSADENILLGGRRLFTESKKIRLVVEEPKGIPESAFGIPLVRKTEDANFYYERVAP
jgi:FkbM family methyltransferase